MENLLVYQNNAIKETIRSVHEETEKYYSLLDEATARFNMELENIESKCLDSKENPDELLNAVTKVMDNMNHVCEEFERGVGYDKDMIKESQINFRKKTDHIISKSYFMNRARIWPQGCQGDYKMLESVYRNTPQSEGIGYYLDRYCLNLALGEGVKDRIKKLEEIPMQSCLHQWNSTNIMC
ncbi:MAG: hypothetical protein HY265_00280 [Deltaproteobacteria bacterium]|nr:hypothetical protein [Deltaproteobacteria bacterium]